MKMMNCEDHKMTRKYLVCLDSKCRNKLICYYCHQSQTEHEPNAMDEFIIENRNELKDMFNRIMNDSSDITNNNEIFM